MGRNGGAAEKKKINSTEEHEKSEKKISRKQKMDGRKMEGNAGKRREGQCEGTSKGGKQIKLGRSWKDEYYNYNGGLKGKTLHK